MEDVYLRSRYIAFPVTDDGTAVGLVTLHQLRDVPRDTWPVVSVRQIMIPIADSLVVDPDENMMVVLDRLQASPARRVLVMKEGRLAGIITANDVAHWLERARQLDDVRT
jgi:CBS domain-containing protein